MRISLIARAVAGAAILGFALHAVSPAQAQHLEKKGYVTMQDFIRLQNDVNQLDPERRKTTQIMLDEAMGRVNDPDDRTSLVADYNNIVAILNGAPSPYDTVGER